MAKYSMLYRCPVAVSLWLLFAQSSAQSTCTTAVPTPIKLPVQNVTFQGNIVRRGVALSIGTPGQEISLAVNMYITITKINKHILIFVLVRQITRTFTTRPASVDRISRHSNALEPMEEPSIRKIRVPGLLTRQQYRFRTRCSRLIPPIMPMTSSARIPSNLMLRHL